MNNYMYVKNVLRLDWKLIIAKVDYLK